MRVKNIIIGICLLVIASISVPVMAAGNREDLGQQTLELNDGWAAYGTNNLGQPGTTGGANADAAHVYTVSSWQEFRAALGGSGARGDKTPRIIYIQGQINANTGDAGNVLTCDDYAAGTGYSLEGEGGYLQAYDPSTWDNEEEPFGPLEDARVRAAANQAAQIRQYVGSNVTIIGLGDDAQLVGANLVVRDSDNVIIRNIEFSDAYDCFPQWDPTDGDDGNWNSAYDNLWIANSTHVWVDHNTFNDGDHPASSLPTYFGRKFEVHDGLLDITNAADLVTVSYNVFENHDKTMLIGSTNNPRLDRGKLRVTLHHNLFDNILQRAPRVRFGQVHVYNNCYLQPSAEGYSYAWGVGVESQIYAENNYFELGQDVDPASIIRDWGGTMIHESRTMVNGQSRHHAVSLLDAYNATHDPDLRGSVDWTPTLYERIDPTQAVCPLVRAHAGAGNITGQSL